MNVQYLTDAQGRRTAIVIPIEEWNAITTKYEDLKSLEDPERRSSDFSGTLSQEVGKGDNTY